MEKRDCGESSDWRCFFNHSTMRRLYTLHLTTTLQTLQKAPKCTRHFSQCPIRLNPTITPFTRRLFKLPPPPPPPSQHHHDLPSFLTYAERIALPPTSTTYIGTHYEYIVQQTLRRFAFALHRVGGRDDAGVDLLGTWHLPQREHPLRVFVQCKAMKTKLGPNLVRELEGSFRVPPVVTGWSSSGRGEGRVGVLVGMRDATRGVRDAMARSAYPMVWMMVDKEGALQQALWNVRVEEMGLGALGVEMKHYAGSFGATRKDIALTWDGEEIPGMDRVERDIGVLESRWLDLWEHSSTPESSRLELLDLVERMFPEEKPLITTTRPTGTCSTLTGEERHSVLHVLRDKVHQNGKS